MVLSVLYASIPPPLRFPLMGALVAAALTWWSLRDLSRAVTAAVLAPSYLWLLRDTWAARHAIISAFFTLTSSCLNSFALILGFLKICWLYIGLLTGFIRPPELASGGSKKFRSL